MPEGANRSGRRHNALCGDRIAVHLRLSGDRIADVGFQATGCAISVASASLLTERVVGLSPEGARALSASLQGLWHGVGEPGVPLGELAALAGVARFPVRIPCAAAAWLAMEEALAQGGSGSSRGRGLGLRLRSAPRPSPDESRPLDRNGSADCPDPVDIPDVDRDGIVHNIYWLTAAELGYLGILAYVLLRLGPFFAPIGGCRRDRTLRGDVLLGFAASLLVTYMQGKLEWALRMTQVSYVLWTVGACAMYLSSLSKRRS